MHFKSIYFETIQSGLSLFNIRRMDFKMNYIHLGIRLVVLLEVDSRLMCTADNKIFSV